MLLSFFDAEDKEGIERKKRSSGQKPDHRIIVGFYPHPYASVNLQVQRVSANPCAISADYLGSPCGTSKLLLFEHAHCIEFF